MTTAWLTYIRKHTESFTCKCLDFAQGPLQGQYCKIVFCEIVFVLIRSYLGRWRIRSKTFSVLVENSPRYANFMSFSVCVFVRRWQDSFGIFSMCAQVLIVGYSSLNKTFSHPNSTKLVSNVKPWWWASLFVQQTYIVNHCRGEGGGGGNQTLMKNMDYGFFNQEE